VAGFVEHRNEPSLSGKFLGYPRKYWLLKRTLLYSVGVVNIAISQGWPARRGSGAAI
jgi:hypothetical protein